MRRQDDNRRANALVELANADAPPVLEELDAHLRFHLGSYKLPPEIVAITAAR